MPGDRQPMTSKERTALCRARKDADVLLANSVKVTISAPKKLVEHGMASPEELFDKNRLSDIVFDFLDCWGRGTLHASV
jgi:hypothetical protein